MHRKLSKSRFKAWNHTSSSSFCGVLLGSARQAMYSSRSPKNVYNTGTRNYHAAQWHADVTLVYSVMSRPSCQFPTIQCQQINSPIHVPPWSMMCAPVAALFVCFLDIKFGTILPSPVDNTWKQRNTHALDCKGVGKTLTLEPGIWLLLPCLSCWYNLNIGIQACKITF